MTKNINDETQNIVFNKDDHDANDFLTCWKHFKSRPSKIVIFSDFDLSIWDILKSSYNINEDKTQQITEILPREDDFISTTRFFIKINKNIYLSFVEFDNTEISNLTIYYNQKKIDTKYINSLLEDLKEAIIIEEFEDDISLFNSLTYNYSSATYDLIPYRVNDISDDIDMYFNNDVFKKAKKAIKDINKNKKGLTIFYGTKGTGKTSFVHYLMDNVNKKVIHIPSSMIEQVLNNVDFIHYLDNHKNTILIFDDAEVFFRKGPHKNLLVSNLLQMIDGVLSNNLYINILLSVNLELDNIDKDLFNCNTLLNKVNFPMLNPYTATKLSKLLKKKNKYKKDIRLTDVLKSVTEKKIKPFGL